MGAQYKPGRFFNDQEGTFAIAPETGNVNNHVSQQQSTMDPIRWGDVGNPSTIIGPYFQNYQVNVSARVVASSSTQSAGQQEYIGLCGRLGQPNVGKFGFSTQSAVCLTVTTSGNWSLDAAGQRLRGGEISDHDLVGRWLELSLAFTGDKVAAQIKE